VAPRLLIGRVGSCFLVVVGFGGVWSEEEVGLKISGNF
jgi:hypothetical protein